MFTVAIANHHFTIDNKYSYIKKLCKDYVCRKDGTEMYISVSDKEIQDEQFYEFPNPILESLAIQRKITEALIKDDIILFHGSVVAVDNKAYLFTAKSGTGKSTHTNLWMQLFKDRAIMVNDDKPFLQITDTGVVAYGTPWNGKHNRGNNIAVPLKALIVLERGITNEIAPITKKESWPYFLKQAYQSTDAVNLTKTLDLLDKLGSNVELYRLKCNMDIEAAQIAYDGMNSIE